VIVLYSGQVKLVDFGVAKVVTSVDDGLLKGKTGYLAPELLDGAAADRRSDVWSLGVVLWEALTLRRLFVGRTEEEAIARIRAGEVPPPSAHASLVPRDLDEICFRALARDPERRYPNANEMQLDLAQILRHASWSGGTEPIARFMRSQFADRITARRELLKELATTRQARASTLERFLTIEADSPSPPPAEVIGAHGTGRHRVPEPELVPTPAPTPTLEPERLTTAAPTVRMPTLRRRVGIGAVIVGALIGGIAAAMTVTRDPSPEEVAAPEPTLREAAMAMGEPPVVPTRDPAPVEAVAIDAGVVEELVMEADEEEDDDDDDRGSEKRRDRKDKRRRDRDRDRDQDDDEKRPDPPEVAPTPPGPETARSLTKAGLQKFVAGDVGGAIALFDRARAKDSGYAPAYRGLGMAYEKRGDRSRAKRAFQTYLKLAPKASDAASIRARMEKL
jgi:hypothetical protein